MNHRNIWTALLASLATVISASCTPPKSGSSIQISVSKSSLPTQAVNQILRVQDGASLKIKSGRETSEFKMKSAQTGYKEIRYTLGLSKKTQDGGRIFVGESPRGVGLIRMETPGEGSKTKILELKYRRIKGSDQLEFSKFQTEVESNLENDVSHAFRHLNPATVVSPTRVNASEDFFDPEGGGAATFETSIGSTIDVMFVFTHQIRQQLGDDDLANLRAVADLSFANAALDANQVTHRFRIAHVEFLSAHESAAYFLSGHDALDQIQASGRIRALRGVIGADMVTLYHDRFTDACGVANIWRNVNAIVDDFFPFGNPFDDFFDLDPRARAYSVVAHICTTDVLAHELGHNLGLAHDIHNAEDYCIIGGGILCVEGGGYFNNSFGFNLEREFGVPYRTIMSYSPGSRLNAFSDPNLTVFHDGTYHQIGRFDRAYNAATLMYTMPVAANWFNRVVTDSEIPAPTGVTASDNIFSRIELNWDHTHNAYNIYTRSNYGTGLCDESDYVTTVDEPSYSRFIFGDDRDVPQFFWIKGVYYPDLSFGHPESGQFRESECSSIVTGMGISAPEVLQVQNLTATNGTLGDRVVLNWDFLDTSQDYRIYRTDTLEENTCDSANLIHITPDDEVTTFQDFNVNPGQTYYYWVRPRPATAPCSHFAIGSSALVTGPFNVQVTDGLYPSQGVQIQWDPPFSAPDSYRLYRTASPNPCHWAAEEFEIPGDQTSYFDHTAFPNVNYYYSLASVKDDFTSLCSEADVGTYIAPSTGLVPPWNVQAQDGLFDNQIYIAWNFVADVTGYKLYASADCSGEPIYISNTNFHTSSFNHTGLTRGQFIRYSVRTYSNEGESECSRSELGSTRPKKIRSVNHGR